jgi:branched-chain amino acid transport system ATP-binding protein
VSLILEAVDAGYGHLSVLHDVSLRVETGQIVSLIGANGVGKTTTLRTIAGLVRPTGGSIEFDGRPLVGLPPHEVVGAGVVQVPEGRELFPGLTVQENLHMGGYTRSKAERAETLQDVLELFPILAERRKQVAGTMSGGQQQILAIGRALMGRPRLLMLDEPSLGLAPKIVAQVFDVVLDIQRRGITVLLVEQNASRALEISDHAYVLESGHVALDGAGRSLLADERVKQAYLGMGP